MAVTFESVLKCDLLNWNRLVLYCGAWCCLLCCTTLPLLLWMEFIEAAVQWKWLYNMALICTLVYIPSLLKWKLYSITNQKQHSSLGVRFFCNSRSRNFKTHNRTRNETNFCKRKRYALTYMKNVCPFASYSLPPSCLWLLQNQLVPHFHSCDASSYTNLSPWMQNILDFCPRFEVLLLKRWTKASKEPGFRS